MTEYKYIMFYSVFLGFLSFLVTLGAPIFTVPGLVEPPSPPDHWWEWPGYLLSMVGFFFSLLVMPEVPTELRFMTFLIFLPFIILLVWIILKWIGPIIASAIPF